MKLWITPALFLAMTIAPLARAEVKSYDWQAELQAYKANVEQKSTPNLYLRLAGNTVMIEGTCASAIALSGAAFIAETLPVMNGLPEIAANAVDPEYETFTYQKLLSWEAFMELARGTAGGGLVGAKDALKFVFLWLTGQGDQGFEGMKKMYASSFATTEALFAKQGKCLMSLSKQIILRTEIQKRQGAARQ
ncbi:MAG TPA: hypothetical protein VIH99_05285 [Bdellovibrionota bacterium]|jgi:hypothetical protein